MVIYIFITIMLIFLSERHKNVQCDGKNSLICYLFFNLFSQVFNGNDTAFRF